MATNYFLIVCFLKSWWLNELIRKYWAVFSRSSEKFSTFPEREENEFLSSFIHSAFVLICWGSVSRRPLNETVGNFYRAEENINVKIIKLQMRSFLINLNWSLKTNANFLLSKNQIKFAEKRLKMFLKRKLFIFGLLLTVLIEFSTGEFCCL